MLTLQQIADQIIADPTLRVVFVAASAWSARSFTRGVALCLEGSLELSEKSDRTLAVSGWDKRSPTLRAIGDGGWLCGSQCDLLIYELRSRLYPTDRERCYLSERGKIEAFNWDYEMNPPN